MAAMDDTRSGAKRLVIIGALGVIVVLVAIGLNFWTDRESEEADVAEQAPAAAVESQEQAPPSSAESQEPMSPTDVEPSQPPIQEAGLPVSEEVPEKAPKAVAPSFDVVRINPEGDTVIAGRAAPNAEVTIYDEEEVIGTVTADPRGEWVFIPAEPLPPGQREFSLSATSPQEQMITSESKVVLVVPERGKDIVGRPTDESSTVLALKVPSEGFGATTVLQTPSAQHPIIILTLDVVDYDEAGNIILSGRSPPGERVQIYLDNRLIGLATGDENGTWQLTPGEPVPRGIYTVRVDQLDAAGKVIARIELPFTQTEPMFDLPPGVIVVIEPGNSLWRIARRVYGKGVEYSVIYQANRDQIRNPNLIYPGQIFALPRIN